MNVLTSRKARVVAASLVQLALVPLAVTSQLSPRLTGEEYLLEVAPLDPIDPFRGAYVALAYPGLPNGAKFEKRVGGSADVAYVLLVRSGDLWTGLRRVSHRSSPHHGPRIVRTSGLTRRSGAPAG